MSIKLILSSIFFVLMILGASQRRKAWKLSLLINLVALPGLYFIWFPEVATEVGQLLGVGRGADLVLYIFVMSSLVVGVFLYLKIDSCNRKISELTRHIALTEANFRKMSAQTSHVKREANQSD